VLGFYHEEQRVAYSSSFRRRPESSGFIYMPLGFVRYAKNLIVWIPACAGMTN
jgi:hypothetical protein